MEQSNDEEYESESDNVEKEMIVVYNKLSPAKVGSKKLRFINSLDWIKINLRVLTNIGSV